MEQEEQAKKATIVGDGGESYRKYHIGIHSQSLMLTTSINYLERTHALSTAAAHFQPEGIQSC